MNRVMGIGTLMLEYLSILLLLLLENKMKGLNLYVNCKDSDEPILVNYVVNINDK